MLSADSTMQISWYHSHACFVAAWVLRMNASVVSIVVATVVVIVILL